MEKEKLEKLKDTFDQERLRTFKRAFDRKVENALYSEMDADDYIFSVMLEDMYHIVFTAESFYGDLIDCLLKKDISYESVKSRHNALAVAKALLDKWEDVLHTS